MPSARLVPTFSPFFRMQRALRVSCKVQLLSLDRLDASTRNALVEAARRGAESAHVVIETLRMQGGDCLEPKEIEAVDSNKGDLDSKMTEVVSAASALERMMEQEKERLAKEAEDEAARQEKVNSAHS